MCDIVSLGKRRLGRVLTYVLADLRVEAGVGGELRSHSGWFLPVIVVLGGSCRRCEEAREAES